MLSLGAADIEEDLGPNSRVLPGPYAAYTKLLVSLGARYLLTSSAPRVVVSSVAGFEGMVPFFQSQMDNPALSDLHCTVGTRVFYCHKLVFCAVCEPLRVMFVTTAMAQPGVSAIEMPEWVSCEAFECAMRYVYCGVIEHLGKPFTVTQDEIVVVCSLLQLADYW